MAVIRGRTMGPQFTTMGSASSPKPSRNIQSGAVMAQNNERLRQQKAKNLWNYWKEAANRQAGGDLRAYAQDDPGLARQFFVTTHPMKNKDAQEQEFQEWYKSIPQTPEQIQDAAELNYLLGEGLTYDIVGGEGQRSKDWGGGESVPVADRSNYVSDSQKQEQPGAVEPFSYRTPVEPRKETAGEPVEAGLENWEAWVWERMNYLDIAQPEELQPGQQPSKDRDNRVGHLVSQINAEVPKEIREQPSFTIEGIMTRGNNRNYESTPTPEELIGRTRGGTEGREAVPGSPTLENLGALESAVNKTIGPDSAYDGDAERAAWGLLLDDPLYADYFEETEEGRKPKDEHEELLQDKADELTTKIRKWGKQFGAFDEQGNLKSGRGSPKKGGGPGSPGGQYKVGSGDSGIMPQTAPGVSTSRDRLGGTQVDYERPVDNNVYITPAEFGSLPLFKGQKKITDAMFIDPKERTKSDEKLASLAGKKAEKEIRWSWEGKDPYFMKGEQLIRIMNAAQNNPQEVLNDPNMRNVAEANDFIRVFQKPLEERAIEQKMNLDMAEFRAAEEQFTKRYELDSIAELRKWESLELRQKIATMRLAAEKNIEENLTDEEWNLFKTVKTTVEQRLKTIRDEVIDDPGQSWTQETYENAIAQEAKVDTKFASAYTTYIKLYEKAGFGDAVSKQKSGVLPNTTFWSRLPIISAFLRDESSFDAVVPYMEGIFGEQQQQKQQDMGITEEEAESSEELYEEHSIR